MCGKVCLNNDAGWKRFFRQSLPLKNDHRRKLLSVSVAAEHNSKRCLFVPRCAYRHRAGSLLLHRVTHRDVERERHLVHVSDVTRLDPFVSDVSAARQEVRQLFTIIHRTLLRYRRLAPSMTSAASLFSHTSAHRKGALDERARRAFWRKSETFTCALWS